MGKVTIKEVAQEAGVSIATVSRVLNKNCVVKDELIQRVNSAIEKLGYYPNSAARTLKSDSSRTVAFVVSDISNIFFTVVMRAVEDVLNQYGYNLFVCSTDADQEREMRYLTLLREKQIDGLIINVSGKNNDFITTISKQLPIVLLGRQIPNPGFTGDYVDNNNFAGLEELTRHLLTLGHRKIALLNGEPYVSSNQERFGGFSSAMRAAGISIDDSYPYLYNGNFARLSSGMEGAKILYERGATAIIAANNLLALGALQYCHDANISIPSDLSLCSFGAIANHNLMSMQPTYVDQFPTAMGVRAAELIIERIEAKNNLGNREIRFSTQLVVGNSTQSFPAANTI